MPTPDLFVQNKVPNLFVNQEESSSSTPDLFVKDSKTTLASGSPAREVAFQVGAGVVETLTSGATSVLAKAGEGLVEIASSISEVLGSGPLAERDKVQQTVNKALGYQPQTTGGVLLGKEVSKPFEWLDAEGQRVGETDRAGFQWLLEEQGMDKETATTVAGVLGTMPETAIRAIPYIFGFKGVRPEVVAKHAGDKGFVPEGFQSDTTGWADLKTPEATVRSYKEHAREVSPTDIPTETTYEKPATWDVVNKDIKPGIDQWEKITFDNNGEPITALKGTIDKTTNTLTVTTQETKPTKQGQGYGSAALKEVVDDALDRKMQVKSDATLTEPAVKTWEHLAETGDYIIERNPDAVISATTDGVKRLVSDEPTAPIFKIHERTLKGDEVRNPPIDYGKYHEEALIENENRDIAKAIDKTLEETIGERNKDLLVSDERPVSELRPDLYSTRQVRGVKHGTGAVETVTNVHDAKALDLPDRYGEGGRLIPGRGQYIPGKFVGIIKHNPVVKWVTSQISRENLWVRQQYTELMFGSDVVMRRGKPVMVPTDRGLATKYSKLTPEEQTAVIKARIKYDDPNRVDLPDRVVLETDGLTPAAIDFFYAHVDAMERVTISRNATAKEINKTGYTHQEFPMHKGYFPHVWLGDFRTFIKDKAGNVLAVIPSTNIVHKAIVEKAVRDGLGDRYVVSSTVRKSKSSDISAEAINDMIGKASEAFPENAKEIQTFLESQKDVTGMNVHGMNRGGARGYLGDPLMTADPVKLRKDFMIATETFLHGILRNESQLRMRFKMDALESDRPTKKLYPNSIEYSKRYVDDNYGRKTMAEEVLSKYTAAYFGESGIATAVGVGSRVMTYPILLLGSIPNIVVQPFQIGYGTIKSLGIGSKLGISSADVGVAWARGMMDMFTRTPENLDVAKEAGKRGAVSPEFIESMHEAEALQGRPVASKQMWKDVASGKLLYAIPDEYSRLAQVYGFYRTLRAGGQDHQTAKLNAIELSQRYSVEYNTAERPAAYRGTAGSVIGKFQTWSSNQYAQMLEGIDIAKHGDMKPLAAYLAYSAAIAGAMGFWGREEADALVSFVNRKFGTAHPLPSMVLMEHAPDWVAHGPVQAGLGISVGTTDLPSFNRRLTSFPIISFYSEIVASMSNLATKQAGLGTPPTKLDVERALVSVAPRSMASFIKQYVDQGSLSVLKPDEKYLSHNVKTGKGEFWIDRETQLKNRFGVKSVDQEKVLILNEWVRNVEEARKLTIEDWAKYVAYASSMGADIDMDKFAQQIAPDYNILPNEFNKLVFRKAKEINTSIEERLLVPSTPKGKRAAKLASEYTEQTTKENNNPRPVPNLFMEEQNVSVENRRINDLELAQRVAKLEVTSVQNTTILGDIDKKVTELSNQFLKHKGFMGGVIFTVSGLWAALLVGIDFLWRK